MATHRHCPQALLAGMNAASHGILRSENGVKFRLVLLYRYCTIVLVMSFQFNCTSDETTWKKRPLRFKILLKLIWTVIIVDDNSASRSSQMHTYPSARSGSMLTL